MKVDSVVYNIFLYTSNTEVLKCVILAYILENRGLTYTTSVKMLVWSQPCSARISYRFPLVYLTVSYFCAPPQILEKESCTHQTLME